MKDDFQPSLKRWLAPKEAADYLGCSRAFLDKERLTGIHVIPFTHLGRHIRYDRADLDAFLERGKEPSPSVFAGQEEYHG